MSVIVDTDNAPIIRVGGEDWCVPLLTARQNRIIDPLILMLLPVFSEWQKAKEQSYAIIAEKEYDALLEIAFQAIKRASPDLSRDAFMDLPITLPELAAAFPVIAQQTGIFVRGDGQSAGELAGL